MFILRALGLKSDDVRILIAGLDSAGKTTVLLKLKRGEKRAQEHVTTIPSRRVDDLASASPHV